MNPNKILPHSETLNEIVKHYGLSIDDLFLKSRKAQIVSAKHSVYYILRHKFGMKYSAIADLFDIDHTTVIYAFNNVDWALKSKGSIVYKRHKIVEEICNKTSDPTPSYWVIPTIKNDKK